MTQEQREAIDELLVGYLDAPPDELHDSIKPELGKLVGKSHEEILPSMKAIKTVCVNNKLAGTFTLMTFDILIETLELHLSKQEK